MKTRLVGLTLLALVTFSCAPATAPTLAPSSAPTAAPATVPRATDTSVPPATATTLPTAAPPTAAQSRTSTPPPTSTVAPSRTPAPTATAFPIAPPAGVPDPKLAAAERLDAALTQLATTLGLAKDKIQISYYTLKDSRGNALVYAVANYFTVDISQQVRHVAPLLVASQTSGGWEWKRVGFRVLGDAANLQIGVMMDTTIEYLLDDEFNFALLTSGWGESTQPRSADAIQFNHEDYHLGLANNHGIVDGRIMHLIFGHRSIPAWVQNGIKDGSIGRDQLIGLLKNYITTMVRRYSDRGIHQFVVVNEPYRPEDVYALVIGPEYVEIAFQAARDANPDAILLVNETDNHTARGSSTQNTKTVLDRLKKQGFDMGKIGVGVQAHIWQNQDTPPPGEDDVVRTLRGYRQTYGVDVYITEMDVNMRLFRGDREARFKAQAEIYGSFVRAALSSGVVKGIGFWTPIDQLSWYVFPQLDPEGSPDSVAGMWEGAPTDPANPYTHPYSVSPKPSYYAVLEELFRHLLEQNNINPPAS